VKLERTVLALALSLAPSLACGGGGTAAGGASASPVEVPAPVVVDLEGLDAALDAALDAEGRRGLLVNFWATWCAPCVAEMPELVEVAREWRAQGGDVVAVSYDLMVPGAERGSVAGEVAEFLERKGFDLEVLVFDGADYDAINERFGLPGNIPATLALDADGTIVDREEGKAGRERFEEMMREALGR